MVTAQRACGLLLRLGKRWPWAQASAQGLQRTGPAYQAVEACLGSTVRNFSVLSSISQYQGLRAATASFPLPNQWARSLAAAAAAPAVNLKKPAAPVPPPPPPAAPPASSSPKAAADDESSATAPLSPEEYRQQHKITIQQADKSSPLPDPMLDFHEMNLPGPLLKALLSAQYSQPTTIQAQGWPFALAGRDLVAIAATGSGKTAGFLIPALVHILQSKKDRHLGPTALVLAPTRELAQQIQQEAEKFGKALGIKNACLYGGASRGAQGRELLRGPGIVIGTPGRTMDFIQNGECNVSQVSFLVLDEADRMLDMGFEKQLTEILASVPRQRQTLLYSATWPAEVQDVARQYARNDPAYLFIGEANAKPSANPSITQLFKVAEGQEKLQALRDYLASKPQDCRVIVFAATKSRCDWLEANIKKLDLGLHAMAIHGDKSQKERDHALYNFKKGRCQVLVATDVAARGLDISNVTAVVNFDFPMDVEMYVHRIGRTGRAGASGESLTLLANEDASFAPDLIQILEGVGQVPPPELEDMARRRAPRKQPWGKKGGYNRGGGGGGAGYSPYGRQRGPTRPHREEGSGYWGQGQRQDRDNDSWGNEGDSHYGRTRRPGHHEPRHQRSYEEEDHRHHHHHASFSNRQGYGHRDNGHSRDRRDDGY